MIFNILIFLFALGLLIFFHEMGHFIAAKIFGVYVDRFSLGMPPRIAGARLGETDYCIGALPIGGYVKMAGQEDAPRSEEEQQQDYAHVPEDRWYNKKPVWQRLIILVAGPLMNVVLAVLLYAVMVAAGSEVPETEVDSRIGMIEEDSPAQSASLYAWPEAQGTPPDTSGEPDATGWQTGDRILRINGEPMRNMGDIAATSVLNQGSKLEVVLERPQPDGSWQRYVSHVQPKKMEGETHPRFGVAPFRTVVVDSVMEDSPAGEHGLQPGDVIRRANGEWVDLQTFTKSIQELDQSSTVELEVERDGEVFEVAMQPMRVGQLEGITVDPSPNFLRQLPEDSALTVTSVEDAELYALGFREGAEILAINGEAATGSLVQRLYEEDPSQEVQVRLGHGGEEQEVQATMRQVAQALTGVDLSSPLQIVQLTPEAQEEYDLLPQDIIVEIDGQPATPALLHQYQEDHIGEEVELQIRRPAIGFGMLRSEENITRTVRIEAVGMIGITMRGKRVFYRVPPAQVFPEAVARTGRALDLTFSTLGALVTGKVSHKDLGGPVMIYQATTQSARLGMHWFLNITAFISVNLAIFNLLPLPVLDGGQCVFCIIEGIRRKPVDVRIQERVQQFGVILILGLLILVTYNDITRLITSAIPN